jgi:hypothetical protein
MTPEKKETQYTSDLRKKIDILGHYVALGSNLARIQLKEELVGQTATFCGSLKEIQAIHATLTELVNAYMSHLDVQLRNGPTVADSSNMDSAKFKDETEQKRYQRWLEHDFSEEDAILFARNPEVVHLRKLDEYRKIYNLRPVGCASYKEYPL